MRKITMQDIEFLKNLQEEMNAQETDCQAEPRFWVITGTERKYVGEDYGECSCVISKDAVVADNLDEFVKYIKDYYEDELIDKNISIEVDTAHTSGNYTSYKLIQKPEVDLPEEVEFDRSDDIKDEDDVLNFLSDIYGFLIKTSNVEILKDEVHVSKIKWEVDEDILGDYICEISEMIELLVEHEIVDERDYEEVFYTNEHHIYPNTMFITKKDAKQHLESNHYHYSKDAHTYAMTAWRSPSVSQLYDILHNVDWSKVKVEADDD